MRTTHDTTRPPTGVTPEHATLDVSADAAVELAGARMVLMGERTAAWGSTLLAADLHLGKGEAMRRVGVGVPGGVLDETLARLGAAVARVGASRLLVLGDLLHAPAGLTDTMIDRVRAWREALPVEFVLVPGNHDRGLARVADAWRLRVEGPVLREGPFAFMHEPGEHAGAYTLCGHVHPAVRVGPRGRAVKLPAFVLGATCGVLPACSAFTDGATLRPNPGERVFVVGDGRVLEAPVRSR